MSRACRGKRLALSSLNCPWSASFVSALTGRLRINNISWSLRFAQALAQYLFTGGHTIKTLLKIAAAAMSAIFSPPSSRDVLLPIGRSRLLLTADRAFADVKLIDLLNKLRVCFVIRTKDNIKVYYNRKWVKLKHLRLARNQRRRSLGRLRYCQTEPRRLYVTQSRKRDRKGKWGIWHLLSNQRMSAQETTKEYGRRFRCEEGFRDAKRLLGFAEARIECIQAWARMFTLVAVAMLILYGIGCYMLGKREDLNRELRKVMSRRRQRAELSLMRAMAELIRKDESFWDVLDHRQKLNLLAAL